MTTAIPATSCLSEPAVIMPQMRTRLSSDKRHLYSNIHCLFQEIDYSPHDPLSLQRLHGAIKTYLTTKQRYKLHEYLYKVCVAKGEYLFQTAHDYKFGKHAFLDEGYKIDVGLKRRAIVELAYNLGLTCQHDKELEKKYNANKGQVQKIAKEFEKNRRRISASDPKLNWLGRILTHIGII
jgi:hypothetical protein